MRAFEEVYGHPPRIRGKAGGTDASFIKGMAGIPFVLHGPGGPSRVHVADEHVAQEELVRTSHPYTLATLDLLS